MAAPAFALLIAMQTSSIPAGVPSSPSIWSPPQSVPAPAPSLPMIGTTAENVGALALSVRRQIRAELHSGEISPIQARAFHRDVDALDGCDSGFRIGDADLVQVQDSLMALSSLVYAAGSAITPK